jgi:signal transduction histidine kinase/PAS domain-containing protein
MRMTLRKRLILYFGLWLLICFMIIIAVDGYLGMQRVKQSVEQNLQNITDALSSTLSTSFKIYQDHVSSNIRSAEERLQYGVRLSSEQTTAYTAENQITLETEAVSLPTFQLRSSSGKWEDLDVSFALELTELLGGTVTVFQVFEKGLLRISTSVPRKNGESAVGTYIPTDSPVYRNILDGKPFKGRAFVVHDWYITTYNPLRDPDGEVIGAIYVGVSQQDLDILREQVSQFRVDKSYYTTVFDIHGDFIIHPLWAGLNAEDLPESGAPKAMARIRKKILEDKIYQSRIEYVLEGRERINYYSYNPETDWIVLSGIDADVVRSRILENLVILALTLCGIFFVLLVGIGWLSQRIARPIQQLTQTVTQISKRNFDIEFPEAADAESRQLTVAFRKMTRELREFYHELEEKVRARTNELEEKNLEIQEAHDKALSAVAALQEEMAQRRVVEAKLSKSEAQYRTLVTNLPGIFFRCEPTPPYALVFASAQLDEITDQTSTDLVDSHRGFDAVILEEDRSLLLETFGKVTASHEDFDINIRFNCANGETGWFKLSGSVVVSDGIPVSIDCVAFDISQQHEAETKLQTAREQAAEQRGKLEMSSSVLHDIGNAITNANTTVNRLMANNNWTEVTELGRLVELVTATEDDFAATLGKEKAAALSEFVKELHRSVEQRRTSCHTAFIKLASIVQHVTEILHLQRRYSHASYSDSQEAVDIRQIVEDSLSIFSGSVEKRDIHLKLVCPENSLRVSGDRTRLLQVFNNVIKNACEAIDSRVANAPDAPKEIFITFGKVGSDCLEVKVADSGSGFSAEDSAKFFQRGYTSKEGGSGIGLDQCRQILRAHNGDFDISSEGLGKGATVTIRCPLIP